MDLWYVKVKVMPACDGTERIGVRFDGVIWQFE